MQWSIFSRIGSNKTSNSDFNGPEALALALALQCMAFTVCSPISRTHTHPSTRIWRMPNWWNDVLGVISCRRCAYLGFRTCTHFERIAQNWTFLLEKLKCPPNDDMAIWRYCISKIENISTRHAERKLSNGESERETESQRTHDIATATAAAPPSQTPRDERNVGERAWNTLIRCTTYIRCMLLLNKCTRSACIFFLIFKRLNARFSARSIPVSSAIPFHICAAVCVCVCGTR